MTDRIVTALITEDGPLQGAEVRIYSIQGGYNRRGCDVDVHLDAIGSHPARWVPLQDVDQYLADLADADPLTVVDHPGEPLPGGLRSLLAQVEPEELARLTAVLAAEMIAVDEAEADPLAEVAASHADRAAARTERRTHDAG